jgi:UDP-N-acetylmuramate--alanine ligase
MVPDHLDIYGTPEAMEDAFIEFTGKIKSGGWLIHKYGLSRSDELKGTHRLTYSLSNASSNFYTENLRVESGTYFFDVQFQSGTDNWRLSDVHLQVGGLHNVENAVAAIAVARILKIDDEKIKAALKDFKGVKRRFEYVINPSPDAITLIDDYAHHPAELKALISGARSLFGKQKLILAFQPHLFSRTKDLADAFAESLDAADEVLLLPIYPARELPMEGVTSELIFNKMNLKQKQLVTRETLLHYAETLQRNEPKPFVFITAGAGDIDSLLSQLKEKLTGA